MIPQKIVAFLTNNIVSVLSVTILTGATVSSSLLGVAKATGNFTTAKLEVPVQTSSDASSSSASPSAAPSPTPHVALKVVLPSGIVLSKNSASSQNSVSNACIITLFGNKYDVTTLQDTHSGGNVFVCGTDQTALYQSQHGNNVDRMQPYLVTAGGSSLTAAGQSSSAGSRNSKKEKENHGRNQDDEEEAEVNRE